MNDSAKYLINARITADGVVERSDVVGAVFGQTEGLLGDELDLRDLQQSSKIGRIDVDIDSENGQSFGEITIGSGLDKVETSILAASLEAITRVGPCEARVEVTGIEDMRAAKRREVVERAKELLADTFDDSVMDSTEILNEVREANRVERIDEYKGLPAGPRVQDSDAIIVVEGRSDVLTLLKYGIKNGIAVEGTNVPDAVADLSQERTVTAFLDGDRGGELILKELAQVGDIDYVAFAPERRSVEDLARHELMAALREKVPFESVDLDGAHGPGADSETAADDDVADRPDASGAPEEVPTEASEATEVTEAVVAPEDANGDGSADANGDGSTDANGADGGSATVAATDGSAQPAPEDDGSAGTTDPESPETTDSPKTPESSGTVTVSEPVTGVDADATDAVDASDTPGTADVDDEKATDEESDGVSEEPLSLRDHVERVIAGGSNSARVLDAQYEVISEVPAADAVDAVSGTEGSPFALVVDGEVTQRVLDVAAQRGVEQVIGETQGEYVKRPANVHVATADRMLSV